MSALSYNIFYLESKKRRSEDSSMLVVEVFVSHTTLYSYIMQGK